MLKTYYIQSIVLIYGDKKWMSVQEIQINYVDTLP
jgi:hypothetical protein